MPLSTISLIIAGFLLTMVFSSASQAEDVWSPRTRKVEKPTVVDLLLGRGGTIEGQLKEAGEQLADGATVTIWQGQKLVWKGTADQAGKFQLKNMTTGMYKVVCGEDSFLVRAWSGETAPPQAKGALILNRQKTSKETDRFFPRMNLFFPPVWSETHDDPRLPTRP
jgi:hypothetical protein